MTRPTITNRRELAQHLQEGMMAARPRWTNEEEPEIPGRTAVKTYLLEAHTPTPGHQGASDLLTELSPKLGLQFARTSDPELFLLRAPKGQAELWCDTSFGRFWRIHTTSVVEIADLYSDRLTGISPWLDKIWLPSDYLRVLPERLGGSMEVFSLRHDRRPLTAAGHAGGDLDFFSMRLWASNAARYLDKLRAGAVFPHGLSMRSVRLVSGSSENPLCTAEYFHNGKITVTGNSFDEHNRLVLEILRAYQRLVETIEQGFWLRWKQDDRNGKYLSGGLISIEVEWTIEDMEHALSRIFGSIEPFRLWGIPQKIGERRYRAYAVDLHVAGVLTIEISPTRVVVQIPEGTCGNTVVRLLGNLQAYVNADAVVPFPAWDSSSGGGPEHHTS